MRHFGLIQPWPALLTPNLLRPRAPRPVGLVSRSINTISFADGACEGRSRSEEEAMQGHRRRRETQRSSATSISPKGGGGTASISLSLLLRDAHRHRVVVASRTRCRRARHKRHHIYGTRHLPAALTKQPDQPPANPGQLSSVAGYGGIVIH